MRRNFIEVTGLSANAVADALFEVYARHKQPGLTRDNLRDMCTEGEPLRLPETGRSLVTCVQALVGEDEEDEAAAGVEFHTSFLSIEGRHWLCGVAELDAELGGPGRTAQVVEGIRRRVDAEARQVVRKALPSTQQRTFRWDQEEAAKHERRG